MYDVGSQRGEGVRGNVPIQAQLSFFLLLSKYIIVVRMFKGTTSLL